MAAICNKRTELTEKMKMKKSRMEMAPDNLTNTLICIK